MPKRIPIRALLTALAIAWLFPGIGAPAPCGAAPPMPPPVPLPSPPRASENIRPTALSHELAWLRARQLGQVSYVLWFGLDEEHDDYEGRAVIRFELRDLKKAFGGSSPPSAESGARSSAETRGVPARPEKLTYEKLRNEKLKKLSEIVALDFEQGTVRAITINGMSASTSTLPQDKGPRFDGHRIYFEASELLPSRSNRIEITFSHPFSHDGQGLHRFQDPVDKSVYLYTDLEPYEAHRVFPCFDQPDLKASYELTVEAPESWQIISNTAEREITRVDGRRSWAFPASPVFSTYVFALHAGPYAMWKADANGIPIRLFSRRSVRQFVNARDWLDLTRKGLEYYATEFGFPYPYAKYDQVIVPDFNEGAMENVAAVTFSEDRTVRRSRMTLDEKRDLADTILHEMAHMWFGDLVTMRWWNGLWLNESFATFTASRAIARVSRYPGISEAFFEMKSWAYRDDQLVTTHPIEVPVPDTDAASTEFDGITYGKGASVLRQLNFYLSPDDFREGVQRYFQKYAWRNTSIHDFIRMLSEASGNGLSGWPRSWLQTAGVNGLRANWACQRGRISSFSLIQTPPAMPPGSTELRPHRTRIALFSRGRRGRLTLRATDILTVSYDKAETPVPKAVGKACPALVFPNYGDFDYAKVALDPVSLEVARHELANVDDPLLRQMLWNILWQRVVDGGMRAQDFADTLMSEGGSEKVTLVLRENLRHLADPSSGSPSATRFMGPALRREYQPKIEAWIIRHLKSARAGSDLQRVWFEAFLRSSEGGPSRELARALLSGHARLAGLPILQEERWRLIGLLAAEDDPQAPKLITAELKRDPTDMGQKAAVRAEAAIPVLENKKKWLAELMTPLHDDTRDAVSIAKLRNAAGAFQSTAHEELISASVDPYFQAIPELDHLAESPYAPYFALHLYPSLCSQEIVDKTTATLAAHPELPAGVVKALLVRRQEEERCVRARARSAEGS